MKKKIKLIILVAGIGILGCSSSSNKPKYYDEVMINMEKYQQTRVRIYEYSYKEHKYQFHYVSGGWDGLGSAIHDPDCPCNKKK